MNLTLVGLSFHLFAVIFLAMLFTASCSRVSAVAESSPELCSKKWVEKIDALVVTGDGQGHGPDNGSDEWKSVVEFKLGLRGNSLVPSRESDDWCDFINRKISVDNYNGASEKLQKSEPKVAPSFSCSSDNLSTAEEAVCSNQPLAELDQSLSAIYKAAEAKVFPDGKLLKASQRGWIKGRDECWKSPQLLKCIEREYIHRIAELQAKYGLVKHSQVHSYYCGSIKANEFLITFYETNPPTLIAERGDSVSLMFEDLSKGQIHYAGPNESIALGEGVATIIWGYGQSALNCKRK